ncbi:MAG: ThiF family adenylyltransferase [Acidobacteriota bacterium]
MAATTAALAGRRRGGGRRDQRAGGIDRDYVGRSNLQRLWLYEESEAEEGLPKAIAAARRLALANSGIEVTPVVAAIQVADAMKILCAGTASVRVRITTVDVWSGEVREIQQPGPQPDCQACRLRTFVHLEGAGRAIIKGTTDVGVARSLYARYIGS